MTRKSKGKNFIISVIGRDFRKTPEPEEERKGDLPGSPSSDKTRRGDPSGSSDKTRRGDLPRSPSSGNSNILKNDRTHYRIEYTKDGPKFWTLH